MSRSANVLSVQTLKDFKVVMCNFAEEARNSLGGVDMELRRMRDWLERDQLGYWQAQIKRRQEAVMEARADLHRRKISQQGSEAVSDSDQKEALREAQRRLAAAEEKLAVVKRLIPYLHHAIDEYHSHSQPLGDHLTGGFEKSVFALEKMISSLEAYLALKAPSAPQFGSASETSAAPTSAGAATSGQSTTAPAESPSAAAPAPENNQSAESAQTTSPVDENLLAGKTT
jgi:hypothetical protein